MYVTVTYISWSSEFAIYMSLQDLFDATGWLGWAMVLGSFQCQGVLLLLHIVGQGPAVLAAGAGWVRDGWAIFLYFSSIFPF